MFTVIWQRSRRDVRRPHDVTDPVTTAEYQSLAALLLSR
jgi:hypothetical protein